MGATEAKTSERAGPGVYGGLFFTTLSTLMYEIMLTRVFSVTMWYHFAFVAVSVALFGLTVGALIVHLAPGWFAPDKTRERLAQSSILFAITIVLSFVTQLSIPFQPEWSLLAVYSVTLTYLVISVPFIFSGIAVALSLTRFPNVVSRLYAADLVGAGLGTITLIWLLGILGDGPSAVLAIAALAAVGAACYAGARQSTRGVLAAGAMAVLLGGFAIVNAMSAEEGAAILHVVYAKGDEEDAPIYERWNAFSRIRVGGDASVLEESSALTGTVAANQDVEQLYLTIDATAGTTLTRFDGDQDFLEANFRRYVANLAHYVRPDSNVVIVGTGGGWDVLSALAFRQPSITGLEMNSATLEALNGRYGEFTGHLDQRPDVRFVNDEARSYLAREEQRYDIIHVPMTDTWAATAAGAFALSENGLYTVDAWQLFLDRLHPNGILSVTRWFVNQQPVEAYRLVSLAAASLRAEGIDEPRDHIVLVRSPGPYEGFVTVATILVSREPFSTEDLDLVRDVVEEQGFISVLLPDEPPTNSLFA